MRQARTLFLAFLVGLGVAAAQAAPVCAAPMQAPNSRVVLDLPPEYQASPLFSGFQNEGAGISFVIMEAPASAYAEMAAGFTPERLAARGITEARRGTLARSDEHVFMRATQSSAAGSYRKFFVLFRTVDQAVLVSVNAPAQAIESGAVAAAELERVLATATTVDRPYVRELYRLRDLGPFKEAGSIAGTSKLFTLDGRMDPERKGEARAAFLVAPSLDKRMIEPSEESARQLLASLSGFKDVRLSGSRRVEIAGLHGYEIEAQAREVDDDRPMRLYQALLIGKEGGYFRMIGMAPEAEAGTLIPEFARIARSFTLVQ